MSEVSEPTVLEFAFRDIATVGCMWSHQVPLGSQVNFSSARVWLGAVGTRQGVSGAGGQQQSALGRFWRSLISPGGREPWGALEDRVTPGRN